MAHYSMNKPNRTVTLHKNPECGSIPKQGLNSCGCGETGESGNQLWACELHFTLDKTNEFMGQRFWAILLCDRCYREK